MSRVPEGANGDDFVQSLARGLAVIKAFDAENTHLTLTEVARRAEISPAAARRFLRTLISLGYVRGTRTFQLTPRVLELGFSYLSALSLPEIMQPHLEALSRVLDESVSAAVLDKTEIVYVARVPTRRIMTVGITIGTRFPAYATSMGRVLLAARQPDLRLEAMTPAELRSLTPKTVTDLGRLSDELERVELQGWALVDGELEAGLRSIAAPVFSTNGTVVAAINVSTSASRVSLDDLVEHHLPRLLQTTAEIDADLRLL